jgi:drug/metabolite transporter (DMT)-like permease
VRLRRLAAIAVGLSGLILVLGPSGHWLSAGGLAGLGAGVASGFAHVAVRRLRRDHPLTVVFHFSVSSALLALPGTLYAGRLPVGWEWPALIGIGGFAALGQWLMTRGYKYVEASAGSVAGLLTPVLTALAGVALGEGLGLWQLSGAALVVAAGVYLSRAEARRSPGPALPAA